MLSVSPVTSSASTTPMSDSGSEMQDRQRIEERAELDHQDQVHQQHRGASAAKIRVNTSL